MEFSLLENMKLTGEFFAAFTFRVVAVALNVA